MCKSVATVHDLIDQHKSSALVGEMSVGSAVLSCVCSPEGLHAPPVPPAIRRWCSTRSSSFPVFLFRAQWSIKTIFLMFVLFTPVLDHPWMSTLWRVVASGRIILFQSQTVCPFKSSSTKATLIYALCPLHPAWHSKSLWEHKRALLIRFHQCIIWMSFFLLATHLNHVHASCCVDVWYPWTEARRYKS